MTQAGIVAKLVAILKMIVQEYGTEGPDASAIPIITGRCYCYHEIFPFSKIYFNVAVFESLLMIVSVRPKIILGDEQFIHVRGCLFSCSFLLSESWVLFSRCLTLWLTPLFLP